jgi:hypothetical protein
MNQQQAVLLRQDDLPRVDRGNGTTTTRLVNRSCGSQSMVNGIMTIPLHYHNCEEGVLVFSGAGFAIVGEIELAVKQAISPEFRPICRTSFEMDRTEIA